MGIIRILFFDMEFANGKVKGSVYSLGYMITDEEFRVLTPPTDLLIAPECEWNDYVKEHILAYPIETVESSPTFPTLYGQIVSLISSVDVAVGFSVSNDVRALRADCVRYALPVPTYRWFDIERLCRKMEEHKEAHGLDGYFAAWCEGTPDHRHRSDGDAYATARVMEAICRARRVDAEMLIAAYPECGGIASETEKKKKPAGNARGRAHAHRRRRGGARKGTAEQTKKENKS